MFTDVVATAGTSPPAVKGGGDERQGCAGVAPGRGSRRLDERADGGAGESRFDAPAVVAAGRERVGSGRMKWTVGVRKSCEATDAAEGGQGRAATWRGCNRRAPRHGGSEDDVAEWVLFHVRRQRVERSEIAANRTGDRGVAREAPDRAAGVRRETLNLGDLVRERCAMSRTSVESRRNLPRECRSDARRIRIESTRAIAGPRGLPIGFGALADRTEPRALPPWRSVR